MLDASVQSEQVTTTDLLLTLTNCVSTVNWHSSLCWHSELCQFIVWKFMRRRS